MPGITFDAPPVFEMALSVQFEAIPLTAAHYGLFWAGVRERYPLVAEQPPIDPTIEEFGASRVEKKPGVRVLERPETPRMWFLSADGTELIQLQRDRFVRNWRQHVPGVAYPRYPALRSRFETDFLSFVEFVEREGLGDLGPTQVEVTYINHVPALSEEGHSNPHRHFAFASMPEVFEGDTFENARVIANWVMRREGKPIGRLHADLRPAHRNDNRTPIWSLNLVARGAPLGLGLDGVVSFMDAGRARIVAAFDRLTTEEMHREWNKR